MLGAAIALSSRVFWAEGFVRRWSYLMDGDFRIVLRSRNLSCDKVADAAWAEMNPMLPVAQQLGKLTRDLEFGTLHLLDGTACK